MGGVYLGLYIVVYIHIGWCVGYRVWDLCALSGG